MSVSSFETGEGSVSADRDPSSGVAFVHATFSHKGRRKKGHAAAAVTTSASSASRLACVR
jgi:hypothetical protein